MFGSRKEAEEKYEALQAEHEKALARIGELEAQVEALTKNVDTLTAQADVKLEAFKNDLEEKLAIAVAAGVATEGIYDIVNAETVKDAAIASVKAVRSEGATVENVDIDATVLEKGDDDAAIQAAIKAAKGE